MGPSPKPPAVWSMVPAALGEGGAEHSGRELTCAWGLKMVCQVDRGSVLGTSEADTHRCSTNLE